LITICGVAQTHLPMNHVNELSELEKFSTFEFDFRMRVFDVILEGLTFES